MTLISAISVLVLVHCVLVLGDIQYETASGSCTQSSADYGTAIFCCTGSCYDGTSIGNPGLCLNRDTGCLDPDQAPSCPQTQVMIGGPASTWIGAGIGNCWFGECNWQLSQWQWNCCDCPAGFVSTSNGACGTDSNPFVCVGCSDSSEVLTYNGTDYSCEPHLGISCDIVERFPFLCKDLSDCVL